MSEGKNTRLLAVLLGVFITLLTSTALADELLDKAENLISQKQNQAAFELLVKELPNRAGTADFDLLLGISALDSGHPTMAVFSFEPWTWTPTMPAHGPNWAAPISR